MKFWVLALRVTWPPPDRVAPVDATIRLVPLPALVRAMVPVLSIAPLMFSEVLLATVTAPWLCRVEAEPSSRLPPSVVVNVLVPVVSKVPPARVAVVRRTSPPAASITPPVEPSTVVLVMVRPAAPVASISPALVTAWPEVLSTRALAAPVASMTPDAWLTRVSWPFPSWPAPEMVLSALVRVSVAAVPTM